MGKIKTIAEIEPKGDFPVVSAPYVQVGTGSSAKRLDTVLTESATAVNAKADKSYVDSELASRDTTIGNINTAVGTKANKNYVDDELAKKVDKVSGKGLSTNDYTTADKDKLSTIASGATKVIVDTALSSTSTNPVQNKVVTDALSSKVDNSTFNSFKTSNTAAINAKADKTYVDTEVAKKASVIVDAELSSTSTNPVQNKVITVALSSKVDNSAFNSFKTTNTAAINAKADKTYVDTEVAKKASTSDLTSALATKADSSTVSALSSRVGTNETNIATQTARIDSIVATPSGQTEGNAELIDIRTGADGKTYTSAGDAVRKQISDVNSNFNQIESDLNSNNMPMNKLIKSQAIYGSVWNSANGGIWNSGDSNHVRFPMFEVSAGGYIYKSGLKSFAYYKNDSSNGQLIGDGSISFTETTKIYFSCTSDKFDASYFGIKPVNIVDINNNSKIVPDINDKLNQSYDCIDDINYIILDSAIYGSVWNTANGGIYNSGNETHVRFPAFKLHKGYYQVEGIWSDYSYFRDVNGNNARISGSTLSLDRDATIYITIKSENINKCRLTRINCANISEYNALYGSLWNSENGGVYNSGNNNHVRFKPFKLEKGAYHVEGVYPTFSYYKTESGAHGNIYESTFSIDEDATIYFSGLLTKVTDVYNCKLYPVKTLNEGIIIGENEKYTTLRAGLAKALEIGNCSVYVKDGVYDIIEEYGGNSHFENMTEAEVYRNPGLLLGNNIHVVFSSGAKVVCNYTGNNQYVQLHFAPFNADNRSKNGDFILENCRCEASRVKYVMHDEYNGYDISYKHIYKNCDFKLVNTNNEYRDTTESFGGGCGTHGYIELDGCNVTTVPTATRNFGISWHNANNNYAGTTGSLNRIFIKNCRTNGKIQFKAYGNSETKSTMTITGSKFLGEPVHSYTYDATWSSVDNVEIVEWGNTKISE